MERPDRTIPLRVSLTATGAVAGLALWVIAELLPDVIQNGRAILAVATAAAGFFGPLMIMLGPLTPSRALAGAGLIAVPLSILATSASMRFETVGAFVETGHPIAAMVLSTTLPIPYLIAGLGQGRRWMHYPTLFGVAWQATVRSAAAVLFLGLFWLILYLSDALLQLVGIELIDWISTVEALPFILSGLVLGLGAAVAFELSNVLSPMLPIRLLRLLLPIVLAVTAVFLGGLALRGLGRIFGDLSIAASLITMSAAAALLVSAAVDGEDASAVRGRLMQRATAALALIVPGLAGLAIYSVTERVSQYGWSPDRLAALSAAVVMMAYGVAYAVAILPGAGWMARIRQANGAVALAALALAIAWLSPLLNPQRLSAANQVARFEAGTVPAEALDLWAIGREWGRPGAAALDRLVAVAGGEDRGVLEDRRVALSASDSRYAFENRVPPSVQAETLMALRNAIPVRPAGAELPTDLFARETPDQVARLTEACNRRTPGGNPGCLAARLDLWPGRQSEQFVIFTMITREVVHAFGPAPNEEGPLVRLRPAWLGTTTNAQLQAEIIDTLLEGRYQLGPPALNALEFGGTSLLLLP